MIEMVEKDKRLQVAIRVEMAAEALLDSDAIGITVADGLVVLSGHVPGMAQRRSAEAAALRVEGVRAIIDELKCRPSRWVLHDVARIALASLEAIRSGGMRVVLREGLVRLVGTLPGRDREHYVTACVQAAVGRDHLVGLADDVIAVEPGDRPETGAGQAAGLPILKPGPRGRPVAPSAQATAIIVLGTSSDQGLLVSRAHHREFPEIVGEGATIRESVLRLAQRLDEALGFVTDEWHRGSIVHALRDARAYYASLGPDKPTATSGPGVAPGPLDRTSPRVPATATS